MKKNNRYLSAMVLISLFVLPSSFAFANGSSLPSTDAGEVYNYLTKESPYQTWSLFPGTQKMYKGQSPHGALITTYVSADVKQAIETGKGKLPDGGFIVKENYMPDGTLDAITIMYRVKGYNPDGGDWFWAKYGSGGRVDAAGKEAMCVGCHAAVKDNDWVFVGPIK
ncbi:MAG: cytochrome P460 family protein [Desulfuromonadales bacterium]|nr:cytochrome P460 family protein [Desulfuromonadales bacterium]